MARNPQQMVDDEGDDDAATYPVSPARMQQFNANSQAAGAGGVQGGGPLSQGSAPVSAPAQGLAALQFQGPYQALYQQMQQKADAQRTAQQEYLASLQKQEGALSQTGMSDLDRASMLFQAAGALGQTTRSGGFGETLGNVGTALAGPLSKAAEAQRARAQQLQQLQMARQKLGVEMAGTGGVDPAQAMQLLQAQQASQPKPTETQQLLATLSPADRARAIKEKLGIGEDEAEYKDIKMTDGTVMTIKVVGDKQYDPITNQELDPAKLKALTDSTSAANRQQMAQASGIPLPERDTAAVIKNPKLQEQFKIREMDKGRDLLDKEETKKPVGALQEDIREAQRFLELNQVNQGKTGPIVGMLPSISEPAKEMDKIAIGLSRQMRQPGEGSMSDFDAKQFGKASMSTSNEYATNRNIGLGMIAAKQLEIDRRAFNRDYLSQNGTLDGSQKHWQKYLNDNPVFDKSQDPRGDISNIKLNPNRVGYQDYFRQQSAPRSFTRDENGQLVLQPGQ